MPLFKTGDAVNDLYASYSTEQLIQIVTDKNESYTPGVVESARRILLVRGFDYRTKAQQVAQRQVNAVNSARENAAAATLPRVRINPQNRPAKVSSLKPWHWILIIYFMIRLVGCLWKLSNP